MNSTQRLKLLWFLMKNQQKSYRYQKTLKTCIQRLFWLRFSI